jgi:membrane-bound lytic murein transglycosylase F
MRQLSKKIKRARNRILLVAMAMGLVLYLSSSSQMSDFERIQSAGYLTMLTTPGPTTYFIDGRGENGFEYIVAKAFAKSLNIELRVQAKMSLRTLLLAIGGPRGDFAASNLVKTELRSESLRFSDPYLEVTQHLLYRRGNTRPRSLKELDGDLLVITSSSHSEQLKFLKESVPSLVWREQENIEMHDLMRMVDNGEIDYAVVDSLAYLVNRHIYPNAGLAFDISEPEPMAWAFPAHSDGTLVAAVNAFLETYISSGSMATLESQLLSQSNNFSVADSKRLGDLVANRLPAYEALFREAGAKYSLDWQLLAAVAYQESHWNPRAKSPTGVRGLMMLTLDTAREMNVSNRLDPLQSLEGGAGYFSKLKQRLPDRILEPDRTLFALAAYNVGFGHLEDARILTQRSGKSPDLWSDVRLFLPLLSKKEFYSKSKHGYARGAEPILYVDNIQYYQHYLQLHSLAKQEEAKSSSEADNNTAKTDWQLSNVPSI